MLTSTMLTRGGSNTTVNLAGMVNTHSGAVAQRNTDKEDGCTAGDDDLGSSFFETSLG